MVHREAQRVRPGVLYSSPNTVAQHLAPAVEGEGGEHSRRRGSQGAGSVVSA